MSSGDQRHGYRRIRMDKALGRLQGRVAHAAGTAIHKQSYSLREIVVQIQQLLK
jgi:hypothetical protein